MNADGWKQIEELLPSTYVRQASDAARTTANKIRQLLQHRKMPVEGWDDSIIETLLSQISAMDSNNFPCNCGLGEREGRFASDIVARRHFRLSHGMGRSGDLTEIQPKAVGSSLLVKLTNSLTVDLLKLMGLRDAVYCLLVPMATGMSLVLSMLAFRTRRPTAKYVVWSRIDQKSCFKSIITAGLTPIIVDTIREGDQLKTDVEMMDLKIREVGAEQVVCVMTTTSCFAPRAPDSIRDVARLCKDHAIPHLINNAYGLQSHECIEAIQKAAASKGNVDVFVQSTDKNLMVPVGGAIIASFNRELLESISKSYPGRASSSPAIDAFITLLTLGKKGYESLVKSRKEVYSHLHVSLSALATKYNERVLSTPDNPISIGFTLSKLREGDLTKLGSMLFVRHVSGTRIVTGTEQKTISGFDFTGWGAHSTNYPTPYLTSAAALGTSVADVDLFVARLDGLMAKLVDARSKGDVA